ncbi:transketolase-like protein 1 [Artemia franciscana]
MKELRELKSTEHEVVWVRENPGDKVVLIGAGITMHEGLKATDTLATNGIHVCVIDPFTITPLDADTIRSHALRGGGKILTVEDHYPEGGIGESVACALSTDANIIVKRLAVNEVPRSGPPEVLLEKYGISSNCIVKAVYNLLQ